MKSRYIRENCQIIIGFTQYTSYAALGNRLGIAPKTLRGYWEEDKSGGAIPDKNVANWIELIQEIVPRPISEEGALRLLQSNPVFLLNFLMPVAGKAWAELFERHKQNNPLEVTVRPVLGLSFGEVDDEPPPAAATAAVGQGFYFTAQPRWPGEGVLFAEHMGEWRIVALNQDVRLLPFQHGAVTIPAIAEGRQKVLRISAKTGFYRYCFVAMRGTFPEELRLELLQSNPLQQMALDSIAAQLAALPAKDLLVQATAINIADA